MRKTAVASTIATMLIAVVPAQAHAKHHRHVAPRCNVPNLKGLTLPKARVRLAHAHCGTGMIVGPHAGTITRQVPKAGRHEKQGTKVTLTLKATKATAPTAAPKVSYSTSVDPTFTQDPANPLAVTYTYSADATATINGVVTDLAATGQLPAGILNFYSAGVQVCSINVGGANVSGTCLINYPAAGAYQVRTEYIPNAATAVTQTDTEVIPAYPSTAGIIESVGSVTGNSFPIAFNTLVFGAQSSVISGATVVYTITDQTTGQHMETFSEPASSVCVVVASVGNGTEAFSPATPPTNECSSMVPFAGPVGDNFTVTAYFAGNGSYLPSTSNQAVL